MSNENVRIEQESPQFYEQETGVEMESPPVHISHGTASKIGYTGTLAMFVPVLVDLLNNDTLDEQTRNLLLKLGAILAGVTMIVRGAQAVAAELARGR